MHEKKNVRKQKYKFEIIENFFSLCKISAKSQYLQDYQSR